MATLYLTEQGSKLRKEGRRLIVEKEGRVLLDVPLIKLDSVLLYGNVQLSTQAISALLESGIRTAFLTQNGRLKGQLTPVKAKNVPLRMAQFETAREKDFAVSIAKSIVSQKIENCIQVIANFIHNHPSQRLSEILTQLRQFIPILDRKTETSTILGVEGRASVLYFNALKEMFRQDLKFSGRNRRPPKDPVNALLSFGYVLVGNEIQSLLDAVGFDPYIGYLHGIDYGRPSLALDLLEEFRHPLVDRLVLLLANRRILRHEDFEQRPDGGIFLKRESQKTFFIHYEKAMTQPIGKHFGNICFRDAIRQQIYKLANAIQKHTQYVPFNFYQ